MSLATANLTAERRAQAEALLAFSRMHDSPEERIEREIRERGEDYASVEGRRAA